MNKNITKHIFELQKAAPLAVFRILFGFLMCFSMIRFWYNGWIEKIYLTPNLHFHYWGFEWVTVPGNWTYVLFLICGLSALSVGLGFKYRISTIVFFLSFLYIELMDKTTYLNHYYFISIIAFILIWLPANVAASLDVKLGWTKAYRYIPAWNINALKLMLAIVYFYAGLAKLTPDWMLNALPLSLWLRSHYDLPLLGSLMDERWMHYLFSWAGAIYDLTIVFFLLWKPTRIWAFVAVVIFHVMTRILFPIGMFPFIMICSTTIFFDPDFHEKVLSKFKLIKDSYLKLESKYIHRKFNFKVISVLLIFQLLFPWRFLAYPGHLFWTEQGYRFSWRVMLMEKTGYANFKIVDGKTGKRFYVQNEDFLTAVQQKQMSTQADFIVEYGQYLGKHFSSQGHQNVEVYVESYAALNGRPSQKYIKSDVDLMKVKLNWAHKDYIHEFKD